MSWTLEDVDTTGNVGTEVSMVLRASDGVPFIAYRDITNTKLKLAYGGPGAWVFADIVLAGDPRLPVLGFDSGGLLHCCFYDGVASPNGAVKHTRFVGGSWTAPVTVEGSLNINPAWGFLSMAIKPDDGQPAVAYNHANTGRYCEYNGSAWGTPVQSAPTASQGVWYQHLSFRPTLVAGEPGHRATITYSRLSTLTFTYRTWNGSAWVWTNANVSPGVSSGGTTHAWVGGSMWLCFDVPSPGPFSLRVSKWEPVGNTWTHTTVATAGNQNGFRPYITALATGRPAIIWTYKTTGVSTIAYWVWNGTGWDEADDLLTATASYSWENIQPGGIRGRLAFRKDGTADLTYAYETGTPTWTTPALLVQPGCGTHVRTIRKPMGV